MSQPKLQGVTTRDIYSILGISSACISMFVRDKYMSAKEKNSRHLLVRV